MSGYTIKLETFEGPLELLLELIEKEELDISDVSLSRITDEFLGYVRHFEEKEPAHLADFLVIAARLILIKSKTLLPSFVTTPEEEKELTELKEKLAEYQRVREAARRIAHLERKGRIAFHRPSELRRVRVFLPPEGVGSEALRGYMAALMRARAAEVQALEEQKIDFVVSFEEKLKDIKVRLERNLKESFSALYDASAKINVIVAFLAVLELVKQRFLKAEQEYMFGEIHVTRAEQQSYE